MASLSLDQLRQVRPAFQRANCCSWAIGAHYSADGTVGGDLVPPHEPVVDANSGVVVIQWASWLRVLEDLEKHARLREAAVEMHRLLFSGDNREDRHELGTDDVCVWCRAATSVPPIMPCPQCGGEAYDNIFMGKYDVPQHCGADMRVVEGEG